MTRKKFIKLLMSYGYSRNLSQAVAEIFNRDKIPYKRAIRCYGNPTVLMSVRKETIHFPIFVSVKIEEEQISDY